jgi:6-phosphogluconolactonase
MPHSKFYYSLLSLPLALFWTAAPAATQQAAQIVTSDPVGAVYVATNSATGNEVLVFNRFADGRLQLTATNFPTGGLGTGEPLGNQGGVVLSRDERFLFVVNAGSDDFSVFRVHEQGLELIDVVASSGRQPISIASDGNRLFLLNAGGNVGGVDEVEAFVMAGGSVNRIAGSIQGLSAMSTDPAQVGCTPDGSVVVVTEKGTNTITTFVVGPDGSLDAGNPQASVGKTPFGFAFGDRSQLFVTEAFSQLATFNLSVRGVTPPPREAIASSVTSYRVRADGVLEVIDPMVSTHQDATCWAVLPPGNEFLYTTNTGSDTVTGFEVSFEGELTLLNPNGATARTSDAPIDMDFSSDGRFLYVLTTGCGSVSIFERDCPPENGQLTALLPMLGPAGLPAPTNGLAAR